MKGTTKQFAGEIADHLNSEGIKSKVTSVEDFSEGNLASYDYIFLGCWTKGLMFFGQHPDSQWQKFAKSLRLPANSKLAMFTTYKILTGTMFSRMAKCIQENHRENVLQIKSRNSTLPTDMVVKIDDFIA